MEVGDDQIDKMLSEMEEVGDDHILTKKVSKLSAQVNALEEKIHGSLKIIQEQNAEILYVRNRSHLDPTYQSSTSRIACKARICRVVEIYLMHISNSIYRFHGAGIFWNPER